MNRRILADEAVHWTLFTVAVVGIVLSCVGIVLKVGTAFAGHQWILLHHEDQGQGQPAFEQCMPIESWEGHEDHEGDWYLGPYDNHECLPSTVVPTEEPTNVPTEEPTDVPTEEPTDVPSATPTPTDEPEPTDTPTDDQSPTPTEETPAPTPTATDEPGPTPTPGLPSAGFTSQYEIINGEPWRLTVPGNVWAGHNQEGWPAGEWWKLWEGIEFEFQDQWYTVVEYIIADPAEVELIGRAIDFDLMLITCRNYDPVANEWSERLVIFAELSQ